MGHACDESGRNSWFLTGLSARFGTTSNDKMDFAQSELFNVTDQNGLHRK